ncbi:hypothetical protein V2J09_000666 [Rumex salicifolius]
MQATNLLHFSSTQNARSDMTTTRIIKDESHENGPIRGSHGSPPESPCLNTATSNNNNNKEQDRFLPIANVGRIMKKVIPTSGKISKDAKETVQECVSEFISFVTGEASDKCQREKRKTINGDDIIWAITTLGFEDYVSPLKIYLSKYRELEGEKMNLPKQPQQQHHPPPQQQQQLHHQRMHPHFQRPDQMGLFGGNVAGLGSYSGPVGVFSSQRSLVHHQGSPYVGVDQPFSSSFSPSNSLQKNYHQHTEQIDSVAHW